MNKTTRPCFKIVTALMTALLLVLISPCQSLAELTIERERQMGQKFMKAVFSHFRFIEDPEVVDYVNEVGQRIVDKLDHTFFPFHFYVIDSSALNAFAAPAGHIFINSGLLQLMDNEGELAAVLSHEIGHVQSRHIAERMARMQKLNIAVLGGMLAGIFLGKSPVASQAITRGSLAAATSFELANSRQDEEEADRKGLRYLEAAGYPGIDMVDIFKKMNKMSWQSGGRPPPYLLTHPGIPERILYLENTIDTRLSQEKKLEAAEAPKERTEKFLLMQAKLLGGYADPAQAAARLRQWEQHPRTRAMALYAEGLLLRREDRLKEATRYFKQAVSLRPDLAPFLIELGRTYLLMGELDKAQSTLQSAMTFNAQNPTVLYMLGRVFLEKDEVSQACQYLSQAANLDNRLPSIHYYLGLAFGKLNQLADAHYNFGIYYQRQHSWKNAAFHYNEALRYSKNPERQHAIREALKQIKDEIGSQEQQQRG
ncbi:MAG: M48 family metalloprotease [Deltaproteobacteria bacterium]|nr:M48 family metalloprotease [Deltaproteobacteria bacterium]MBW2069752.1 M48 family metalloprotease [Deltaproteobacteria bacterium]